MNTFIKGSPVFNEEEWEAINYMIKLMPKEVYQVAMVFYGDGQAKYGKDPYSVHVEKDFFKTNETKRFGHAKQRLLKVKKDVDSGQPPQAHVIARDMKILWGDNNLKGVKNAI